jgi:hypothetical protein
MSRHLLSAAFSLSLASSLAAGNPSAPPAQVTAQRPAPPAASAEKLGPDLYRIGPVKVNTSSREVSVAGTVNTVTVLEFAANAKGGMKAYESALTLETDAINFNAALALIGLDRKNAKISPAHFDPAAVTGDPVEVSVEWKTADGRTERAPLDRLIVDKSTNQPIVDNKWVYTGSTFWADGRYAASVEGVLIGFAHTPNSIIESAKGIGLGRYGSIILNPALALAPGSAVTLTVKALQPASKN